jgi:hypothetical protein
MGLGYLSDLSNLDLGQLQGFLQGTNFPAGKQEVASTASPTTRPRRWCSR